MEPLFPFGHGLSYTSFDLTDVVVDAFGVAATVTNTGARAGSTVVQVYVGDLQASVPRPKKELKGFAKVHLAPGESQRVAIVLNDRAFAFFDVTVCKWRVEAGSFAVSTGFSASDLASVTVIERDAALLAV
jgi:beta-glucosidase